MIAAFIEWEAATIVYGQRRWRPENAAIVAARRIFIADEQVAFRFHH